MRYLPLSLLSVAVKKENSSAPFWGITQRTEVSGQLIGPILKGEEIHMTTEDGTDRLYLNVGKELPIHDA
jgi:hypothetical protein